MSNKDLKSRSFSTGEGTGGMRLLITGSNGLLGQHLIKMLIETTSHQIIATGRGENRLPFTSSNRYNYFSLDITDGIAVNDFILSHQPDVIIHAAAVSDYRPKSEHPTKIKSNSDEIDLGKWVPTKKLIKAIRDEYHFNGRLVQFKLETVENDEQLIAIAKKSMTTNQSDLCIANRMNAMEDVIAVSKNKTQKMKRKDLYSFLYEWIKNGQ